MEYTGKLDARSWMKIGKPVNDPLPGHVVVFTRGSSNSWQGHVGLYAGYNSYKTIVYTLGGNQGNQINISPYPVNGETYRLLGFRELNLKTGG